MGWIVAAVLWVLLLVFVVLCIRSARMLTEMEHDCVGARRQFLHLQNLLTELHHELLKEQHNQPLTAARMAYHLRKIFRAAGISMGES